MKYTRFRARISLVSVALAALAVPAGSVADLGADDFVLFEDGEKQEILDIQLIGLAAGPVRRAPFFGASMNRRMYEIVEDLTNTYPARDSLRQLAVAKARTFEAEERNRTLATYQLLSSFPSYTDENEWGISDPLLVTVDEAGCVYPVVLGRFVPGGNVIAFVEVYGGQRPILSGQVFLEGVDPDEEQRGARLFPLAMRPAAGGVHHGMIPLPAGMPPGHYFVQLVITDPPADEHQIVRLPIEVVGLPIR